MMTRRGTITRVDGPDLFVEVATLAPGFDLPATAADTLTAPAVGDTVLVVAIDGTEELIALARLP